MAKIWLGQCSVSAADGKFDGLVAIAGADQESCQTALRDWVESNGWRLLKAPDLTRPEDRVALTPFEDSSELRHAAANARSCEVFPGPFSRPGPGTEWLEVNRIEGVRALDSQIGIWPKASVPDALQTPLFGQPSPDTDGPEACYVVLDTAKFPLLPDLLEDSGCAFRCLFKGPAEEELGAVAPWIVELQEGSAFTRRLFTRTGTGSDLWSDSASFFIRSRASLDEMWRHFRKFTRVSNGTGAWNFFRFWDNPISSTFLTLANRPEAQPLVGPMFAHEKGLTLILRDGFGEWHHLGGARPELAQAARNPVLTEDARALMRRLRLVFEFDKISRLAIRHVTVSRAVDETVAWRHLAAKRDLWYRLGFWRKDHLARLCTWELMLGPDFLETELRNHPPAPGQSEYEVIFDIKWRLQQLAGPLAQIRSGPEEV